MKAIAKKNAMATAMLFIIDLHALLCQNTTSDDVVVSQVLA
jgi:hypothetical protein